MSVLQIGMGFLGSSQQASSGNDAAAKAATQSYNLNRQAETIAFQQKDDAEKTQEFQSGIEAAQARAKARVAAGEAGVSGISVDALVNDYSASEGRFRDTLRNNLSMEKDQANMRVKGYAAQSWSQFNSQKVQQPSFLGAALRIGGAGFDAFNAVYPNGLDFGTTPSSLPKSPFHS